MAAVRGNTRGLARLVVILVCIVAAGVSAYLLQAPPSIVVGSFLGAALSLLVGWFVTYLEEASTPQAPSEFIFAAQENIREAGYYRKGQMIRIKLHNNSKSTPEYIELEFRSEIIPFGRMKGTGVRIAHPKILPPSGLEKIPGGTSYKVGATLIDPDMHVEIFGPTTDVLSVKYKIADLSAAEFKDTHLWPSPVLDYSVKVSRSNGYTYHIGKLVAGGKSVALAPSLGEKEEDVIFVGSGAAFTTQGIEWRIARTNNGDLI